MHYVQYPPPPPVTPPHRSECNLSERKDRDKKGRGGGRCTVCLPDDVLVTDIGHCIQELACRSIQCYSYSSEVNWKIPEIPKFGARNEFARLCFWFCHCIGRQFVTIDRLGAHGAVGAAFGRTNFRSQNGRVYLCGRA